jgi:DNA invertase Pin-like site-specific DNA recombinase
MSKAVALYARVSTDHQTVESQILALKEYCSRNHILEFEMFIDEGISGAIESRPSLNRLMQAVEDDKIEQVIVFSFSRFARSTSHLLKALTKFKEKNVRFLSITEQLDTNSPMGVALFTILGALAQLERELIRDRVRAGLANARAKGKHIGRVKKRDSDLIRKLLKAGMSYRAIATIAKASHGSVHAEKVAMRKEEEALKKKLEAESAANPESPTPEPPTEPPTPGKPTLRLV